METLTRKTLLKMYDHVGIFHENLAEAEKGEECLHIHPDGTPAYKQRYDWVGPFSEGLAVVGKDGKSFHIHPDGTPAYEQRYDFVGPFQKGLAEARKGDERFQIHPDGSPSGLTIIKEKRDENLNKRRAVENV